MIVGLVASIVMSLYSFVNHFIGKDPKHYTLAIYVEH